MSKRKTYLGNYLGIVVANNDPKKRGRVKVFIPHISATIYENWTDLDENNQVPSKAFRFPGSNIDSDLNKGVMDTLKKILPWAECAMPLVGESASGRYHAYSDTASISDTNKTTTFASTSGGITSDITLNSDQIGESPGRKYELQKLKLYDAFTGSLSGTCNEPNNANVFGYNYVPNTYSNKSKGSFSIPAVGAHIWCFFREGDPTSPVYFAAHQGSEDWKAIYDSFDGESIDYPSTFENKSDTEDSTYDINTDTYRNKFVINQKGGVLEFVNTDQKELLKMTHYSGSFKEFNNYANIELATQNDQKLVLEDQFLTVRGQGNYYIGRDSDNLIKGDHFIKIGLLDPNLHQSWREAAREISWVKQLFETQRAVNLHEADDMGHEGWRPVIHRKSSLLQEKNGSNSPCPVCNNSTYADRYWILNNTFIDTHHKKTSDGDPIVEITDSTGNYPASFGETDITSSDASYDQSLGNGEIFGKGCPVCGGTGQSPSSLHGTFAIEPRKVFSGDGQGKFEKLVIEVAGKLKDIEKKMGRGGSQITNIAKHKVETIGLAMNDFGSIRVDNVGKIYRDSVLVHPVGVFNSQKESPLIEYVHVDDIPGGTYTLNVCNKWNVQVGAGGVSMKSFGPVDIGGTIVNMAGEQVNVTSQSEVNIDGGKRLTLVADIISIRQRKRKQVLIDSNLGISQNAIIGGGMHVEGELSVNHVTAPCEIQETEKTELWGKSEWDEKRIIGYLDDGIAPAATFKAPFNVLYAGKKGKFPVYMFEPATVVAAMASEKVRGHTEHLTIPVAGHGGVIDSGAPHYIDTDDIGVYKGDIINPALGRDPTPIYSSLGYADGYASFGRGESAAKTLLTQRRETFEADHDSLRNYHHSHNFKNLPLHLKNTNTGVREVAERCNKEQRSKAEPIENVPASSKST